VEMVCGVNQENKVVLTKQEGVQTLNDYFFLVAPNTLYAKYSPKLCLHTVI